MMENRTAIIVASSLKTIEKCKTILLFEDGEIKEKSKHKEPIKTDSGLIWAF